MLSFFTKSKTNNPLKGYKVTLNNDRTKKFGIAANSLEMLRRKISEKFALKSKFNLVLSDGFILSSEEYFQTIPAQTVVIVAVDGEEVKTGKHKLDPSIFFLIAVLLLDLQIIIESFRKINQEIFQARDLIRSFVLNNKDNDVFNALNQVHGEIEKKTILSKREDDPSWFAEEKLPTKEEVMRRKAQDRIRGYFYKTKDELTKSLLYRSNSKARLIIENLLSDFFLFLNGVDYFSCIFDRTHEARFENKSRIDETDTTTSKPKRRRINSETKTKIGKFNFFKAFQVSLCNELGNFDCHGFFNAASCNYRHQINPYASRESALLFQIFNLDHQIEISRSIFPSILSSIEKLQNEELCLDHNRKSVSISALTYFREIFTIRNLKLVHIICHDKGTHGDHKSKGRVLCDKCEEFKKLQKIKSLIA